MQISQMTTIKIFTYVVGIIAVFLGITLCLILIFPYEAEKLGVTGICIKYHSLLFLLWLGLYSASMHLLQTVLRK